MKEDKHSNIRRHHDREDLAGEHVFGEVREVPAVIRKGVFAVVRHPVYLGAILLYLGLIVLTFSLISVVIWIFIIVFYHFIAGKEEKLLLAKFGEEYERYTREKG